MEMEGLQSDDIPVEPTSSPVLVSTETSGIPSSGSEELTNEEQQQTLSRKRKLHAEEDSEIIDPHEPALKVMRVEQPYGDALSNDDPQSALMASQLEDNSISAAIQDNEQSFIVSHRSALEALLEVDEEDRSDHYGQESLAALRSSDVVENSAEDEFNLSFGNPHGLPMEGGGLQSDGTPLGDVDINALSSSHHPPLSVMETMDVVEDETKFGAVDPQAELQSLHVVEDETKFGLIDPRSELQPLHVAETTAEENEAKLPIVDSQLELEAPIVVENSLEEDEINNIGVNDREPEFDALPLEKGFEEDGTLRMHDPHLELEALNIMGSASEGGANVHLSDPQSELEALNVVESTTEEEGGANNLSVSEPQLELGALNAVESSVIEEVANVTVIDPRSEMEALPPVEKNFEEENAMRMNDPQTEIEALDVVERAEEVSIISDPQLEVDAMPHVEGNRDAENEINIPSHHPLSVFGGLNVSGNADEAHVSIRGPLSRLLQAQLIDQTKTSVRDTLSGLETLPLVGRVSAEEEAKAPLNDPLAELEVPLQAVDDSPEAQSVARKKKMVLLASVAAFFSTLAGALGSIGELVGQLEKAAMGASGMSEDYAGGQFQRTGTGEMASTSSPSESSALRLHSAMSRSSSSIRNNIVVLMFLLMQQHRKRSQKRPRELTGPWYIKPRSAQAFESFLDFSPQGDPDKFRELFRISPTLFFHICEMVSAEMLSDTPRSLRILPNRVLTVERQVAIAIRRLATGNQFLGIADSFGVSKSTAVKVTWKFIVAFIKKARPLHLNWPTGEQLQQIKDGFKNQWGFPNCCGAVDGTHFTVEFPKGEDVSQYYDHQNHVSISMQALVGHDLRFLDVVVGWPGSIQEYELLKNTNFFRSVVETKDRLNGDPLITQDGSSLREYVLGDAGYPLYDWLMVPYADGLSAAKDEWNSRHAVARQCVEDALVRLKGTWKILSRILWKPRKERIGKMVFACCLLHNMIIERNDGLNSEVYAGVNPHPGGYTGVSVPTAEIFEGGPEAREVLFREVMGGGIV